MGLDDFPYVPPDDLDGDDHLFHTEGDWRYQTDFNWPYGLDERYVDGFLRAGDTLVERVIQSRYEAQALAVPIVFCYRQWMELRLKDLFALTHPDATPRKTHNLRLLWSLVRPHLEPLGSDDTLVHVERIVFELADADGEKGMGFRYARDLDGKQSISSKLVLNLKDVRDVMEKTARVLDGCSLALGELEELRREGYDY